MKATIEEQNGQWFATLSGDLDTSVAQEVEETFQPLHKSAGKDVIIECADLEYIASAGLRILLAILKSAKANGSRVVLRHVNEDIKNVFKLTGFINIFEFE